MTTPGVYYGYHSDMVRHGYSWDLTNEFPEYRYYVLIQLFDEPPCHTSYRSYQEAFDFSESSSKLHDLPLILIN